MIALFGHVGEFKEEEEALPEISSHGSIFGVDSALSICIE